MELRTVRWFIVMCYIKCIIETNGDAIVDSQMNLFVPEKTMIEIPRQPKRIIPQKSVFSFRKTRCSRYCIQKKITKYNNESSTDRINLIWSFVDDTNETEILSLTDLVKFNITTFPTENESGSNDSSGDCQIYLDLDCDIIETGSVPDKENQFHSEPRNNPRKVDNAEKSDNSISEFPKTLMEKDNLTGHTETRFRVNESVIEIYIRIKGNLLRAVLEIPINKTAEPGEMVISLTRTSDVKGVRIDARNAPPGGWCMKLTGEENSKYSFTVATFRRGDARKTGLPNTDSTINGSGDEYSRQAPVTEYNTNNGNDDITLNDVKILENTEQEFSDKEQIEITKNAKLFARSLEEYDRLVSRNFSDLPFSTENSRMETEEQNVEARILNTFSETVDLNNEKSLTSNLSMRMTEVSKDKELLQNDEPFERKQVLVEVNAESNLIATMGTIHRVVFDVTNNCVLAVRYAFRVRSSPFRIYNIQPLYTWIYPRQTNYVAVDIVVPRVSTDTVNTLTLAVDGAEITEKTVYIYVQDTVSRITDNVKPTIEYRFNNNCAGKTSKARCSKSRWSVDIVVQDPDSGLKRVTATPNDIYPLTEFISGTKNAVTFYYSSTCCSTTAKITAIDVLDNYNTYTIDVTAWDNLTEAEITAVVLGALLLLLLIILIIFIIVYCVRKRKSHDLPYTHRYGSRPPAQAERTSF